MKKNFLTICCLILLCLLIRLWNVDKESVWWDEYTSLMHIESSSLKQFLFLLPVFDPAVFPLYYTLEYFIWNYIYPSVSLLRLFSILLSLLAILLVYLIGKEMKDNKVGLFASVLFVLSPVYRFYSQGIRTYVLFLFLAILSVWLLIIYTKNRTLLRLFLLVVCNLFLTLTHPFAILVVFCEMFCLLIFGINYLKRENVKINKDIIKYFVTQSIVCIPTFWLLLNLRYFPKDVSTWFKVPTLVELLFDVFADDAVLWGYQVRTIEFSNTGVKLFFQTFNELLNIILLIFFIYLFLRCFLLTFWSKKQGFYLILLSFLVVGPPVLLYIASYILRPCIFPRYTIYGAVFMYLIAGYALENENIKLRNIIRYLLIGIFLVQLLMTASVVQRTDWRSSAEFISQQVEQMDYKYPLVLVYKDINKDVFRFNSQGSNLIVSYVDKESEVISILRSLMNNSKCGILPIYFVYVSQYFGEINLSTFEEQIRNAGVNYEKRDFEGIEKIRVYCLYPSLDITPNNKIGKDWEWECWENLEEVRFDLSLAFLEKGNDCGKLLAEELAKENPLWEIVLRNLIRITKDSNRDSLALKRMLLAMRDYQFSRRIIWSKRHSEYFLEKAVKLNPDLEISAKCLDAIMASVEGNMEYAKRSLYTLSEKFPDEPVPKIALGNIAISEGRIEDARKWYYSAIETGRGVFKEWKKMLDFIFVYGDYQSALREYERLKREGIFVEPGFEDFIKELSKRGENI